MQPNTSDSSSNNPALADQLIIQSLQLSDGKGDFRELCNRYPEIFGTIGSPERRKAQFRRQYFRLKLLSGSPATTGATDDTSAVPLAVPTRTHTTSAIMSTIDCLFIKPNEPNSFGIIATQIESEDTTKGVIKTRLTIRIPIVDIVDMKKIKGKLHEDGRGMRYTMPTSTEWMTRIKNASPINDQITKRGGVPVCSQTLKPHLAICNSLKVSDIPDTVDVDLKFLVGSYNNIYFNDAIISSSDPLSLELKSFGVKKRTGEITVVKLQGDSKETTIEHLVNMSGVAFEMALDTEGRDMKTKVSKTIDETSKLLKSIKLHDSSSDSDEGEE